jgi:hypothetical protein
MSEQRFWRFTSHGQINRSQVLAQDPAIARLPSIPSSAVATGCVDFVLPLERIAPVLIALIMAALQTVERAHPTVNQPRCLTDLHQGRRESTTRKS